MWEVSHQEVIAEIDRILWETWDPIGINDELSARDEYSSYVGPILNLLRQRATLNQLERHLKSIDSEEMRVGGDSEKRRATAEMLAKLAIH
jgi:hypothetical protein